MSCKLQRTFDEKYEIEAGVDECARGVGFGRVYAGAVILDPSIELHPWLNDSKKVTPKRRKVVKEWIQDTALAYAVGYEEAEEVDRVNIRNATIQSMNKALTALKVKPNLAVIDGDSFHKIGDEPYEWQTVTKGDATYAHIAAASILAKECHDEWIRELIEHDPTLHEKYGLYTNVGYLTAKHIAGLKTHGLHPLHRKTFMKCITPVYTSEQKSKQSENLCSNVMKLLL